MDAVSKIVGFGTSESMSLLREALDAHNALRVRAPVLLPQLLEPVKNWHRAITLQVEVDVCARHLTLPV
jgi:hypothetical protein